MTAWKTFELTENHIKLLAEGNWQFDEHCEWGSVGTDCKRPFGNGDVVGDMARIIGIEPIETDDEEIHWPKGTGQAMRDLYEELATALEVVFTARTFSPGVYVKTDYGKPWVRMNGAE